MVTLVAWLLAQTLRNNHARTRYWVWMTASVKFLFPFSLLIAGGEWLRPATATAIGAPAIASAMEQIAQPYPQAQNLSTTGSAVASHGSPMLPLLLLVLWASGFLTVVYSWWRNWRNIRIAVLAASQCSISAEVPVFSSSSLLEPGIFGILSPVLLLPDGILTRLTSDQLNAIVAHEMCHVRRRDNLTFAIHMVVETIFWFHPFVWWIRTRLVEERELACDEAVLQSGNETEVYAEGILNVCKFYVESPLACVSGVSGSDLKKRIVRIMNEQVAQKMNLGRKLLLGAVGLAAVAMPIVLGLAHTAQLLAQSHAEDAAASLPKFEVATVKPTKEDEGRMMFRFLPDGVQIAGMPAQQLLRTAFGVQEDRLLGVPSWAKSDRYDIDAKVDASDAPKLEGLTPEQRQAMMLPLLTDRFNLKYHHETRELPVYVLTIAKGGSKLKESKPEDTPANGGPPRRMMWMGNGTFEAKGGTIQGLMQALSQLLGRTIIDKTGLSGNYDFSLKWTPDMGGGPMTPMMREPVGGPPGSESAPPPDAGGPSLFTALQEQLGLKLESQKGPVDVIAIDHIEQPSPN